MSNLQTWELRSLQTWGPQTPLLMVPADAEKGSRGREHLAIPELWHQGFPFTSKCHQWLRHRCWGGTGQTEQKSCSQWGDPETFPRRKAHLPGTHTYRGTDHLFEESCWKPRVPPSHRHASSGVTNFPTEVMEKLHLFVCQRKGLLLLQSSFLVIMPQLYTGYHNPLLFQKVSWTLPHLTNVLAEKKNVMHQPFWMGFGRSGQNILRTKTWLNATGLENSALNKW